MRREEPIAIVGMAGRYPSSGDVGAFWENLAAGRDCLTTFTDEQLRAAGLDDRTIAHPDFVRRGGVLAGHDRFDAAYFGVPPREALIKSPQQRVLLEVAHAALEDAGHAAGRFPGRVGVFVGGNLNSYEWLHLLADRQLVRAVGEASIQIANDLDYLATSIAWKLDLRGPGVDVQSACSTSLLAVHLAARSLRDGECDMALAGGISVRLPLWPGMQAEMGYFHHPGGIWSSDGYTRTFDARADGTVFGSGAGVVALRPLADAVSDGDAIYAVILGSAANNDGAAKVGYSAPSADGQARAISDALARAGVAPRSIDLVEAHGTATSIGDPIEVAGLVRGYGSTSRDAGWCLIGSVKSNVGHLSAAAGVAGLSKAALALHHALVPRTLHFETPNPRIDFAGSPFRVASEPAPWPAGARTRRAGVSAFGIGGTNVHVVLEEAPAPAPPAPARPWQVLPISALTPAALEEATDRLAAGIASLDEREDALADAAWTLQVGRAEHAQRRAVVCRDRAGALETIASRDPRRMPTGSGSTGWTGVAFLFPGQGVQHVGMGAGLRESEPVFRAELDRCCELVAGRLGLDVRQFLEAPPERAAEAARALARTSLTQPVLFAVEYALARLWMSWGFRPQAMIGHSIGEYVAATLAGVFTLEDAVTLVVERGRLVQALPPGAMLAVPLPEADVVPLLGPGLDLAAVNAPRLCVVSGTEPAVAGLSAMLESQGVVGRRLHTSHAFHSAAMEPALEPLAEAVAGARPRPPELPFVSNVTGTWITEAEATDPAYWARHLRHPVRFAAGLAELLARPGALLEVGPGQTLSALARQQPAAAGRLVVSSLGQPHDATPEPALALGALARCWLAGAPVDWTAVHGGAGRRRAHLPTYPFERERHWAEQAARPAAEPVEDRRLELDDWFWLPSWRQAPPRSLSEVAPASRGPWLLLPDDMGVADRLADRLRELGAEVVTAADPEAALAALGSTRPGTIVHAWSLSREPAPTTAAGAAAWQARCFDSLVSIARALAEDGAVPVRLGVVTNGVLAPDGPVAAPVKATLLGPCRVIPRELPQVTCQVVDVDPHRLDVDRLVAELAAETAEREVAHRGGRRWVAGHEPVRLGDGARRLPLRERGVYLLTGGLGGVGAVLAEHLAAAAHARLVLVGRTASPQAPLVRRLEELGAEVLVLAADVADEAAMGAALEAAEARFGPVHGVVHAAGVPGGGIVQLKETAAAAAVLRPKVTGTAVLWSLLAGRPLDFLVLCSSIISPLGTYGQVDYCAANAFLDSFAASVEGPVVSIAWDGWEDVGMLARTPRAPAGEPLGHPLVQRQVGEGVFASELGPASSWVLDDHRLLGRAVLPGTAYLEMARAAWCAANGGEAPVELRDVVFLRPLTVPDGGTAEVRLTLGGGRFSVRGGDVEHATGTALAGPPGPAPVHDLACLLARCRPRPPGTGEGTGLVAAGPHWDVIREIHDGDGEAVALLELPQPVAGDLGAFWLHPSLLDGATAFGVIGTERQGRFLPLGYGALVARAPLPRRFWSHLRWRPGESASCDVTLLDESGVELVRVERFLLREVDPGALQSAVGTAAGPDAAAIRPDEGVEALLRVLGERPGPCVVVSTRSLPARLARAPEGPAGLRETAALGGERSVATPYVAPETEVEQTVAALWSQLLGTERIGVDDDFFELGGNSLVAIQLVSRIREGFQIEFGIQHVLERPTVRRLAEVVEERLVRRLEAMSDEEVRALLE